MIAFGEALPRIRRRVAADLRRRALSREKVLATVVKLLEITLIRVGNDEYAHHNGSFGLTTLRDRHAKVRGAQIAFEFKGKSGKLHRIDVRDPRLAKLVRRCQDLPGQELFGYVAKDGTVRDVGSADVNAYLREIAGEEFSAKDFRTWAGTVLAAIALREVGAFSTQRQARQRIVRAVEAVAKMLGNTVAVCRRCYIHPAIIDSYLTGQTIATGKQAAMRRLQDGKLKPEEAAVMRLLRDRLRADQVSRTTSRARLSSRRPRKAG